MADVGAGPSFENQPQISADFTQIDLTGFPDKELTQKVIGAAYEVHNELGPGFLETIYQTALLRELSALGIKAVVQAPIPVYYKGSAIGQYYADLLVEGKLIVELKAVANIDTAHEAQVLHYLTATRLQLALIVNFGGSSVHVKRVVKTK
ncbi:MAG: GxxExxY protein [Chloroflexota bacterium]